MFSLAELPSFKTDSVVPQQQIEEFEGSISYSELVIRV